MPKNSDHNSRFTRWSIMTAATAALLTFSTAGVAEAAWTNKTGSGNGGAGANSLAATSSFSATCNSSNSRQVDFSWSTVTGATGYAILDSSSANGTYTSLQSVSGGSSTSANTGSNNLSAGTYYFKIEATAGTNWVGTLSGASGPRVIVHVSGTSYTCS